MTAPTRAPRNSSSDTISIDDAAARLFADLLDENAARLKSVSDDTNRLMLAPTITYYQGWARKLRDQLPTNGQ